MPRLSFWAVRLALIYMLVGFTLGALLLANKGIPFAPWVWNLLPVHIGFLLFGFVVQLLMGVAFWVLPRFSGGSRGNITVGWMAIVFLNLGIWMLACQALFSLPGSITFAGRVFEALAGLLFVSNIWMRVKPTSSF